MILLQNLVTQKFHAILKLLIFKVFEFTGSYAQIFLPIFV